MCALGEGRCQEKTKCMSMGLRDDEARRSTVRFASSHPSLPRTVFSILQCKTSPSQGGHNQGLHSHLPVTVSSEPFHLEHSHQCADHATPACFLGLAIGITSHGSRLHGNDGNETGYPPSSGYFPCQLASSLATLKPSYRRESVLFWREELEQAPLQNCLVAQ